MSSLYDLPWVEDFLRPIREEYKRAAPGFKLIQPNEADKTYVQNICKESDPFDTLHLKQDCYQAYTAGKAVLQKCSSVWGEILVLQMNDSPFVPPWKTWWRAIRVLVNKPVRILILGHPRARLMPTKPGILIEAEHINGGMAMRCDPKTIVLYRQEELTRVLIHELFHASCSDPYHEETPQIEADTEAWAEMVLCAMAAKGELQPWIRRMRDQITYAVRQAATARNKHHIRSPSDYGWRYVVGRLDVWRRLGIHVPSAITDKRPVQSLRLTLCEPKDE